jgi:hypothetical protein
LESNTNAFHFIVEFTGDYRMYVLDVFQGLSDEFNKKYPDGFEIQSIKDDWIFYRENDQSNCLSLNEKGLYFFREITGYNLHTVYKPYTTIDEYSIIKCRSSSFRGTMNQKTKEVLKYNMVKTISKFS